MIKMTSPVLFSGKFSGHSEGWSTVEKDAFEIVEALGKLDHISTEREVHVLRTMPTSCTSSTILDTTLGAVGTSWIN